MCALWHTLNASICEWRARARAPQSHFDEISHAVFGSSSKTLPHWMKLPPLPFDQCHWHIFFVSCQPHVSISLTDFLLDILWKSPCDLFVSLFCTNQNRQHARLVLNSNTYNFQLVFIVIGNSSHHNFDPFTHLLFLFPSPYWFLQFLFVCANTFTSRRAVILRFVPEFCFCNHGWFGWLFRQKGSQEEDHQEICDSRRIGQADWGDSGQPEGRC